VLTLGPRVLAHSKTKPSTSGRTAVGDARSQRRRVAVGTSFERAYWHLDEQLSVEVLTMQHGQAGTAWPCPV
jgi:hypothetical protein